MNWIEYMKLHVIEIFIQKLVYRFDTYKVGFFLTKILKRNLQQTMLIVEIKN